MEQAWIPDGKHDTDRFLDHESYDRFYRNIRPQDLWKDNKQNFRSTETRNCYFDEKARYEPVKITNKRVSFQTRNPNVIEKMMNRVALSRTHSYPSTTQRTYNYSTTNPSTYNYPKTTLKSNNFPPTTIRKQPQITGNFIKMSGNRMIKNKNNCNKNNIYKIHSNNLNNKPNNNLNNKPNYNLPNNLNKISHTNIDEVKYPISPHKSIQTPTSDHIVSCQISHSRVVKTSTPTGRDSSTVVSDVKGRAIRKLLESVKEEAEVKRLNEMTTSPDKRIQHALVFCDLKSYEELVDELFSSGAFEKKSEKKLMEFNKDGEDWQTKKMMEKKEMQSLEWLTMQVFGEEFARKNDYQTSFLNQQLSSF